MYLSYVGVRFFAKATAKPAVAAVKAAVSAKPASNVVSGVNPTKTKKVVTTATPKIASNPLGTPATVNKTVVKEASAKSKKEAVVTMANAEPKKEKSFSRPVSGYIVFMKEFMATNKDSTSGKKLMQQAAEKWKSISETEKLQYQNQAAKLSPNSNKKVQIYRIF